MVACRLRQKPVRIAAAFGTLAVVCFYRIAQMVGAGSPIRREAEQRFAQVEHRVHMGPELAP